ESVLLPENEVVFDTVVEYEPVSLPVFRNVRKSTLGAFANVHVVQRMLAHDNLAALDLSNACYGFDKLRLPIAFDAGNAEDFASSNVERQGVDRHGAAIIVHNQVVDGEHWRHCAIDMTLPIPCTCGLLMQR